MKTDIASISTADQNPDSQSDTLKAVGWDKIRIEKISGAKKMRRFGAIDGAD